MNVERESIYKIIATQEEYRVLMKCTRHMKDVKSLKGIFTKDEFKIIADFYNGRLNADS